MEEYNYREEQLKKNEKTEEYAAEIMQLARDTITVKFRFFDTALNNLKLAPKMGLRGFACDSANFFYDPAMLLMEYMEEPQIAVRAYLHVLFHCIFFHHFQYDKLDQRLWNYATDIAVENIILDLDLKSAALKRDDEERDIINNLKKRVDNLTADKIYREFRINEPSYDLSTKIERLFTIDLHDTWHARRIEETQISEELWKKITEKMKTDLKTFSKHKSNPLSFDINVEEATKRRFNYRKILERFMVSGEEMSVNLDEFDYIYYTYGLSTYGNIPLIEPLEYKEVHKVKEFVIAIDTSASCRGAIVKNFLTKTYNILKSSENFFADINLHIVQCDATIREDTKIKNDAEFDRFIKEGKLLGSGATDFRPVFEYVDELVRNKEFENLKGLIYFTDGYGIYPDKMPKYDVVFAFLDDDNMRQPVPKWASWVIIEDEENK